MDFIQEHSKAFAGAFSALVVLMLKPYAPAVLDPTFEPALEIVVSMVVVWLSVYAAPANKPGAPK